MALFDHSPLTSMQPPAIRAATKQNPRQNPGQDPGRNPAQFPRPHGSRPEPESPPLPVPSALQTYLPAKALAHRTHGRARQSFPPGNAPAHVFHGQRAAIPTPGSRATRGRPIRSGPAQFPLAGGHRIQATPQYRHRKVHVPAESGQQRPAPPQHIRSARTQCNWPV